MMKLFAAAIGAALCALFGSATIAQTYYESPVTGATESAYDSCQISSATRYEDFDSTGACACFAGFLAAGLSEREMVLYGELSELTVLKFSGASQAEMEAAANSIRAAYAEQEVTALFARLDTLAVESDVACASFQREILNPYMS